VTPEQDELSLEGWTPEPGPALPLGRIIDLAFDYRGNVTVVRTDGREVEGYLFNRDADARAPFVQVIDVHGGDPLRIAYAEIRTIRFTGKDPAAGNSYAAWLRRRAEEREKAAADDARDDRSSAARSRD
jgi:hypothetical protein